MCPKAAPTLLRFTVMILSTMIWEGSFKPFSVLGGTVTRSSGASAIVLVMGSTVTLVCSLNGLA